MRECLFLNPHPLAHTADNSVSSFPLPLLICPSCCYSTYNHEEYWQRERAIYADIQRELDGRDIHEARVASDATFGPEFTDPSSSQAPAVAHLPDASARGQSTSKASGSQGDYFLHDAQGFTWTFPAGVDSRSVDFVCTHCGERRRGAPPTADLMPVTQI